MFTLGRLVNAPEPHAIHGVGWQRPWSVLDSDDSFAMLAYEHRADASWPLRRGGAISPERHPERPISPSGHPRRWRANGD